MNALTDIPQSFRQARPTLKRLGSSRLSGGQLEFASLLLLWVFLRLAALLLVPHLGGMAAWLVNYRAGLVRDGLAGSLLIPLAAFTRQPPFDVVVAAQILCTLALVLSIILLLRRPRPAPLMLTLALLSPAALLLQVESPARGGLELVLLAWAGIMAWRASRGRGPMGVPALSTVFLLFTALQQNLFFFIPACLLFIRALHPQSRWGWKDLAWMLAPSALLGAGLALAGPCDDGKLLRIIGAFHGDPRVWGSPMAGLLRPNLLQALQASLQDLSLAKVLLAFAGLLLGGLPILLWLASGAENRPSLARLGRDPQAKALVLLFAASQAALLALTLHWERWVSLDLFLATLGLLAAHQRRQAAPAGDSPRSSWLFFLLLLALNTLTWQMGARFQSLALSSPPEYLELLQPPTVSADLTVR